MANTPFFTMPPGDYAPIKTQSSKPVGKFEIETRISAARLAGGPLCRVDRDTSTKNSTETPIIIESLTWAGLIDLGKRSTNIKPMFSVVATTQMVRLDKLHGQPFPLKTGTAFGWESTYEVVYVSKILSGPQKVKTSEEIYQYDCQVGESKPASQIKAGLGGTATALTCTSTSNGESAGAPAVYQWLDSVGCFVSADGL
ncbi:MAG: hypothetical protein PHI31_16975 [Desulfuromonadaceae bacterium]|nr:hypothetical protein [Desulfuromonadaceae bacterium]